VKSLEPYWRYTKQKHSAEIFTVAFDVKDHRTFFNEAVICLVRISYFPETTE